MIWSAVSVISGDMAGTRNKLRQRASGALLGCHRYFAGQPHAAWQCGL
ncbi:hypothetical protein ACF0H2_08310 [Serratia marcescens]